jgi:hypothetical protein
VFGFGSNLPTKNLARKNIYEGFAHKLAKGCNKNELEWTKEHWQTSKQLMTKMLIMAKKIGKVEVGTNRSIP